MRAARIAAAMLCMGLSTGSAMAWEMPEANKLMVVVLSEGCGIAQIKPRLEVAAQAMTGQRRTSRVVLDWPLDPQRNLDAMGNPSSIVAVLEVSAPGGELSRLAAKAHRLLGGTCPAAAYFVHERRYLSNPRTWPLGASSPGSKTLTTLRRKEGVSLQTFDTEWGGPHAQITITARRAVNEGGSHYVQNLRVGQNGPGAAALDGIGEGGFDGTGGTVAVADRMKTAEHARTFIDMGRSATFIAREVILKD